MSKQLDCIVGRVNSVNIDGAATLNANHAVNQSTHQLAVRENNERVWLQVCVLASLTDVSVNVVAIAGRCPPCNNGTRRNATVFVYVSANVDKTRTNAVNQRVELFKRAVRVFQCRLLAAPADVRDSQVQRVIVAKTPR